MPKSLLKQNLSSVLFLFFYKFQRRFWSPLQGLALFHSQRGLSPCNLFWAAHSLRCLRPSSVNVFYECVNSKPVRKRFCLLFEFFPRTIPPHDYLWNEFKNSSQLSFRGWGGVGESTELKNDTNPQSFLHNPQIEKLWKIKGFCFSELICQNLPDLNSFGGKKVTKVTWVYS